VYIIPFNQQNKIASLLYQLEIKFPEYLLAIEMASLENAYIKIVEHFGTNQEKKLAGQNIIG